ncbi:MAG: DUF2911 domain-containing protein [Cyclobacteriaceae bacterium]
MKIVKTSLLPFALTALLFACGNVGNKGQEAHNHHPDAEHVHNDAESQTTKKKSLSPRTAAMAMIGSNHVHIDYGSPSKRGRMIFGGLVGYGTVWATGAHKATTIRFDENGAINGENIPAGKYGLFTIPGESSWTIIISKDWDMHLADDYNEANDLVRVTSPVNKLDEVVESLTFEVQQMENNKGKIIIKWDQTSVSFDLENK